MVNLAFNRSLATGRRQNANATLNIASNTLPCVFTPLGLPPPGEQLPPFRRGFPPPLNAGSKGSDPSCGDRPKVRLPRSVPSSRSRPRVLGRSEGSAATSTKHPAAFNAHRPDGRGSGLVQYVLSLTGADFSRGALAARPLRRAAER
jgi:hypothetical protein